MLGPEYLHRINVNWLYGPWSKEKYEAYKILNIIPGVSNYMDYILDQRSDVEYMDRNQIDWSDIHDPRKLSQTSSSSRFLGAAYNMVSKNLERLYE